MLFSPSNPVHRFNLHLGTVHPWSLAAVLFILVNAGKLALFRERLTGGAMAVPDLLAHAAVAAVCVLAVFLLILLSGRRSLLLLFYGVQLLYLFANLSYCQFFGYYLYLDEIPRLLPAVYSILRAGAYHFTGWSLVFLADLPWLLVLVGVGGHALWRRLAKARGVRLAAAVLVPAAAAVFAWSVLGTRPPVPGADAREAEHRYVRAHGLLAFSVRDYFFRDRAFHHGRLHVSHDFVHFPPGRPLRNLYLIQVEAMDARVVGCTYRHRAVMPFLSQLRHDSLYYPYTLSYHSGGGTSDCDFAILNSIEPLRAASVFFEDHYNYPNSVVKVLRGVGYGAYAFHGNSITCWGRDRAYPRMGYSDFFDLAKMELAEQGWGAPDGAVFDFAATYTLGCKPPFFAHLITMSSHYPYNSVERYHSNELGDIPGDPLTSRYFNSMNYVDGCLRKLVTELRVRNDGYILIVGDHAPPKLNSPYLRASKLPVGGTVLEFVPLFILGPGVAPRWETRAVASLLDLAPTLLALSGVPCTYATSGIDLSAPPAVLPPIRFDNRAYSRRELFNLCRDDLP